MANYVHNYVFCSGISLKELSSVESNYIFGHYDEHVFKIDKDSYLYVFDSRGMEYKDEYIRDIVSKYRDIDWYCVEENNIEEGHYYWNNEQVVLDIRELCQGFRGDDIDMHFELPAYQPIISVFCSPKELVIEYILQNKSSRYYLSETSSKLVLNFFANIIDKAKNESGSTRDGVHYEYGVPEIYGIRRDVYMHLSQRTLDIMCYDDDDEWKNEIPDGEKHFSETINMIKAIVQQEGGQEHYELESRFLTGKILE